MKPLLLSVALVALAGPLLAQDAQHMIVKPEGLTWTDNRALPKGAQTAVLADYAKTGINVRRHKFPANYRVPPHTHPDAETLTIISGSLGIGVGDTFDQQSGQMLTAGSWYMVPAKHPHFVWTGSEETIVHLHSNGPGGIDYLNPADDPRRGQ